MDQDKKLKVYRTLCIFFGIALIVILIVWGKNKLNENKATDQYDQLSQQVNDVSGDDLVNINQDTQAEEIATETTETAEETNSLDGVEVPAKNLDWDSLHETNSDIYAWIYVPNTNIDYPVVQHPTNDAFYLRHNLDGSYGYPSCIYTELANSKDFTDYNTVIYGHNLKSGKMFRTLHNFEDQTFFEENKYFYIYTEDKTLVYEVFAAYDRDDSHILKTNDFSTEEGYQTYLDQVFSQKDMSSHIRDGLEVTTDDRIVTLSTCSSKSNLRYLVQGVLLGEM